MAILDIFKSVFGKFRGRREEALTKGISQTASKRKGTLAGEILLHGLPPHEKYCVMLGFFPVALASSAPPFDINPRANQWLDTATVKEPEEPDDKPLRFRFQRASGYYYLRVSVIAFLRRDGKMYAQVERFFPMTRPCEIRAGVEQQVQLPIWWPDIPFDELGSYGTFHPRKRR